MRVGAPKSNKIAGGTGFSGKPGDRCNLLMDLGGKTRPNVHLVLASGESVKIDATENQLEGADYLYRAMTLNVSVKEHIRTGEIREARLIGVVKPLREIDEDKLEALGRKGKVAWAGISSPTEWVEQLRAS